MGTPGRTFEYRSERDSDLVDAYRRQLEQADHPFSLLDIMARTVNSPSKRFWVSPERTLCVISELEKGATLSNMKRNKRRMYLEIYRRVRLLRRQPKYANESLSSLVSIVIEQPAPCFYMTPQSAIVIMHQIRKCKRKSSR